MVFQDLKSDIKNALSNAGAINKSDDDVISKCVALASTLHITAAQLVECWTAHSLNKNVSLLDNHTFEPFRQQVIKECGDNLEIMNTGAVITRGPSAKRQLPDKNLPNVTPPSKKSSIRGNSTSIQSKPITSGRRVTMSPDLPPSFRKNDVAFSNNQGLSSDKYSDRRDTGKLISSFNPNKMLPHVYTSERPIPSCEVSHFNFDTNVKESYRHMFTTIDERAKALDIHLDRLGNCIQEQYDLNKSFNTTETEAAVTDDIVRFEEVGVASQDKVYNIGRICNSAHEGKINSTSVLLEGRSTNSGKRVEVDLSKLKATKTSFSMFPGQIVALEGFNTSGTKLVVDRVYEGAANHPNKSTVRDLLKFHHNDKYQDGMPLKIITAAGPFTTNDNIDYKPLMDLINVIRKSKPDVVVLMGPFVDMRQLSVSSGETIVKDEKGADVCVPYEIFFANKVSVLIEEMFNSHPACTTQFILVPSLDDATAEWVFPQPPFPIAASGNNLNIAGGEGLESGTLGLNNIPPAKNSVRAYKRIHCVSNPCTIKVNEVVLGITSADILFDINTDETSANLQSNRLVRIAQHLLEQRSYYPLFPGAPSSNLNLNRMDQWKMPCAVDILITPSKLNAFVHPVLEGTLALNPGHLCRNAIGGSYAVIDVHPIDREVLENAGSDDVEILHNIQERTKVEIMKI